MQQGSRLLIIWLEEYECNDDEMIMAMTMI